MFDSRIKQELASVRRELQEANSIIAALNKSMASIRFTTDGTIIDANDLFLKAMGYRREEIVGKHHRTLCTADYAASQETQTGGALPIGTRVRHPQFGVGVVRRNEGTGAGTKLTVQFERAGLKKLIARFAPLEVVS